MNSMLLCYTQGGPDFTLSHIFIPYCIYLSSGTALVVERHYSHRQLSFLNISTTIIDKQRLLMILAFSNNALLFKAA